MFYLKLKEIILLRAQSKKERTMFYKYLRGKMLTSCQNTNSLLIRVHVIDMSYCYTWTHNGNGL